MITHLFYQTSIYGPTFGIPVVLDNIHGVSKFNIIRDGHAFIVQVSFKIYDKEKTCNNRIGTYIAENLVLPWDKSFCEAELDFQLCT